MYYLCYIVVIFFVLSLYVYIDCSSLNCTNQLISRKKFQERAPAYRQSNMSGKQWRAPFSHRAKPSAHVHRRKWLLSTKVWVHTLRIYCNHFWAIRDSRKSPTPPTDSNVTTANWKRIYCACLYQHVLLCSRFRVGFVLQRGDEKKEKTEKIRYYLPYCCWHYIAPTPPKKERQNTWHKQNSVVGHYKI